MTNTPLWQSATVSASTVDTLERELQLPRRVAQWLAVRQITTPQEARRFLYGHEQFTNPLDFHEMRMAVDRVKVAIEQGEQIVIVGDYDVDGVTASAILASELLAQGAVFECIIPERVRDGYGLSAPLVERAHALGAKLIVTVDNGIRAADAIALANQLSIDVVVTDHHEPGDTDLPPCAAIVHWARHNCPEDAMVLSGAGVAWKFCQALKSARPHVNTHPSDHDEWLLGLASMGAVSDIMPIRGENRRLIREGLLALQKCRRPGFLALCDKARVNLEELSATSIAWRLAPRINAAGRMANARVAFDLLMAQKKSQALPFVEEIEELNQTRRQVTEVAVQEAKARIDELHAERVPSAVVVSGPWPLGVVGIVAAKLVDHYHCPAIVFSDLDDVLRGSGRAPDGFSLHDALSQEACASLLDHFGGHDAAVGCGIHRDNLNLFRQAFADIAKETTQEPDARQEIIADDFLPLEEASLDMLDWLMRFSPHGPENEPLRFFIGPVQVTGVNPLGDGKHVRVKIREGKTTSDVVWFNVGKEDARAIQPHVMMSFVIELEENRWQGKRNAQLRVVNGWQVGQAVIRDVFAIFYRYLIQQKTVHQDDFYALGEQHGVEDVDTILETFVELEFAAMDNGHYHVRESARPRDLREALSYQAHLRAKLVDLTRGEKES